MTSTSQSLITQVALIFQAPGVIANNGQATSQVVQSVSTADNTIINWESYSFDSDFLVTCDAFSFKVGDQNISPSLYSLLMQGNQPVQLALQFIDNQNNVVQTNILSTGLTDKAEVESSRGGREFTIHGRNLLGQVCDAGVNPWDTSLRFTAGMNLAQLIGTVLQPYFPNGFITYNTDAQNRKITTGINPATATATIVEVAHPAPDNTFLTPTEAASANYVETSPPDKMTVYNDPTNTFDLTAAQLTTLKPKVHESKMQFLEKHCERFGCHIWAANDGSGVVVGQPDYAQPPTFVINNYINGSGGGFNGINADNSNNVIQSSLHIDNASMPSAIIAKAMSGTGDNASQRAIGCRVNEFIGYQGSSNNTTPSNTGILPSLLPYITVFQGLVALPPSNYLITTYARYFQPPTIPRIVYIDETGHQSGTQDQLNAWLMREMSEYQKHALVYTCEVDDHQQNGYVWKHNTIAIVNDEIAGIVNTPMWIQKVSFKKSRSIGTITELTMIPNYTISLAVGKGK